MMKVAHVSTHLSSAGGGVSAVVEGLSRAVAETGIEVKVFGIDEEAWHTGDKNKWRGARVMALSGKGPGALGYAPDMARRLIEWQPDVVHVHGIWTHISRSVLQWSKATGKPYIVSPHGMLSPPALRFSPLKKKLVSLLYQHRSFKNAAALHATCETEIEEIRAYGLLQPIAKFANGVAVGQLPDNQVKGDRLRVLSLGRIHPKKGLDRLIKAWAKLEGDFPEWCLDIVGPNENGHAQELMDLRARLGLQRVVIRGPVYGEEKQVCLTGAELFALSTLSENFGLTVVESLTCGTPVISTKGAPWQGLEENECGWWIDHGVEPLAQALRRAMSLSREQRAEMGWRGRTWVERTFSWPTIAKKANAVYRWLFENGAPPACVRFQ